MSLPHHFAALLARLLPPALQESIEGDLAEQFEADREERGLRYARWRYRWGVIRFCRPSIIFRNRKRLQPTAPIMIGNYFKVAARNLGKRKFFTVVNALGLSIGIALCALIWLYLQDERGFDRFHANGEHIVLIYERSYDSYGAVHGRPYQSSAYLQAPLAGAIRDEAPEVDKLSVFVTNGWTLFKAGDKMQRNNLVFVDGDFLGMFDFGFIAGDSATALSDQSSIVLTESMAKTFFDGDALGKTFSAELSDGDVRLLTVTGVIRDVPAHSSLQFEALMSNSANKYFANNLKNNRAWTNYSYPVFVQLRKDAAPGAFQASLDGIFERNVKEYKEEQRVTFDLPDSIDVGRYGYTPLFELHNAYGLSWDKSTNPQYAWILSGLALLVLVIASVNYVTLAVSTSIGRAKEVGVRKTMGARRGSLVAQFATESVLVAVFASAVSMGLVVLFLPFFNEFTSKAIDLRAHLVSFVTASLLISMMAGTLAGLYPALFASRQSPIEVLKGNRSGKVKAFFTRYLVVIQFSLSAFLLISSVVMYSQMQYLAEKDLGFNADMVVVVDLQQGFTPKAETVADLLKAELQQRPEVVSASAVSNSYAKGYNRNGFMVDGQPKYTFTYLVDDHYFKTLGIEMVAGRNFKSGWNADTTGHPAIVNEAFAREIGWTDYSRPPDIELPFEIVGVVRDHHFQSLARSIEPMRFEPAIRPQRMLIRLNPVSLPEAIDMLRGIWAKVEPTKPFSYGFMSDELAGQYKSYQNWTRIMGLSTFFAILIACLGLFGLAGVNAANRTKEVGIRKVMGARVSDIVFLLNRPFLIMAAVAFVLAVPGAWYAMDRWLSSFEYSVALDVWVFALAFMVSLMLALATVSFHAFRAANVNPVETLKYE